VIEVARAPRSAGLPDDAVLARVSAFDRASNGALGALGSIVDVRFAGAGPTARALGSSDATTWREIPQLATFELPAGQAAGWFRDSDKIVHVLTRTLGYYAVAAHRASTTLAMGIVTPRRLWLTGRSYVAVRIALTAPARVSATFVAPDGSRVPGGLPAAPTRPSGVTILRVPLKVTKPGIYKLQLHAAGLGQTVDRTAVIRFLATTPASPVWQDGAPRVAVVKGAGLDSLGGALGKGFVVESITDAGLYDAVDTANPTAAAAIVVDLQTFRATRLAALHELLPEVKIVALAPAAKRSDASYRRFGISAVLPRDASAALVAKTIRGLLRGRY
jgi:hypothetical protein